MKHSRREFIKTSSAALIGGSALLHGSELYAQTLRLPLGLQLYSVREQLPTDYAGTLKQIAALGYREVEAAGYFNHSVAEVKQALHDSGLNLVSSHHPSGDLHKQFDEILAFNKELGVKYIICSSPTPKDPSRSKGNELTLDDWRWNADEFNKFGEKVTAAGLKFGYHNHIAEFHKIDGVVPFDVLVSRTDPSKVTMEMDCGWVIVGGGDPIACLRKYPTRISMLHVKDFKKSAVPFSNTNRPVIAELGQGSIDYRPILQAAAKTGHVKHCFVEQEGFDMPPMESLKVDANYMRKLGLS
ncbi:MULTISPECIES: sugar phosphate isomerase/epimerase [Acidobacteriaceae]|uniref:sugar phosphate isomerase/epimerase family protein n=1 Tax=Acidobacteriaceae TaxID=204434 RepID=UPI0020B155E5|nr:MULTISPECIES: sugar phosphate isomerase/epimerase [Acidobacteriaceae]MDW5266622.1 sugar phosphate isomerase/epimerase [Edaphobacter sp.]